MDDDVMNCEECEYYDLEEEYCKAFICAPGFCDDPLPCEKRGEKE